MKNVEMARLVSGYTMTPRDVVLNTAWALDQVLGGKVAGDFVECGVWRGGHCMLAAYKMTDAGDHRDIWLFDTFEGMSEPTSADVRGRGPAMGQWKSSVHPVSGSTWCRAELPDVQAAMNSTRYPGDRVHFIKGKVEDTLRAGPLPELISVLRLDTDWYESTRAEMEVLFPRLSSGGVLILDDYSYWRGSRKAVDEYFSAAGIKPRLVPCASGAGACYYVKP